MGSSEVHFKEKPNNGLFHFETKITSPFATAMVAFGAFCLLVVTVGIVVLLAN